MTMNAELAKTIAEMIVPGKGILAADESNPTIAGRFQKVGIESSEESRRAYRSLLFTTPGVEEFISGVIMFEETLGQAQVKAHEQDEGLSLVETLARKGIVPGIKVDKGKGPLPNAPGDMITFGLDGLQGRLAQYREQGARFAKWREVYPISEQNPTALGLSANAEALARYAAACQVEGIVPIVEPEVLIDGDHSIERCEEVVTAVLQSVFLALNQHKVVLEQMILKPGMITPGKDHPHRASPEEVAQATLRVLTRCVPAAVPSINFLSGGQSPEEATANLDAINRRAGRAPWLISYSYARALQQPVMDTWKGEKEQVEAAQQAFLKRARLNSAASLGQYSADMEG